MHGQALTCGKVPGVGTRHDFLKGEVPQALAPHWQTMVLPRIFLAVSQFHAENGSRSGPLWLAEPKRPPSGSHSGCEPYEQTATVCGVFLT